MMHKLHAAFNINRQNLLYSNKLMDKRPYLIWNTFKLYALTICVNGKAIDYNKCNHGTKQ